MTLLPSIFRVRPSMNRIWQQFTLAQNAQISALASAHVRARPQRAIVTHGRCSCRRLGVSATVSNKGSSADDVIWLQPADTAALKMDVAHKKNILHYQMSVTINMAKPLEPHHYPWLFGVFSKKVPSLRTCLRERDGQMWLCELKEPVIDFEMCETSDLSSEIKKLNDVGFQDSSKGPMWRVRVMEGGEGGCRTPPLGLGNAFPHQTTFILSFHHGIMDGASAFVVVMVLMEMVEAVLGGAAVDTVSQVGRIASDEQTRPLVREMRQRLEQDPERLHSLVRERLEASFVPIFIQAFGKPEPAVPATFVLESDISSSSLAKFAELCRANGVTFNSGVTAAINIALVELVKAAGLQKDVFEVTSRHAVNLRRYWKPEESFGLGCHIGGILHTIDVPPFERHAFWLYATRIGAEHREMLVNQAAFEEVVVKDVILEESLRAGEPTSASYNVVCDYFLSNLYSGAESTFPEENIRLCRLYYGMNHHEWDYAVCHVITAFGGNVTHYLSYCNTHMTNDTARAFLMATKEVIMQIIRD